MDRQDIQKKLITPINKYEQFEFSDEVIFMNDGYVELDEYNLPVSEVLFKLNLNNKFFKYQAHLYYKALTVGKCFTGTYLDLSCGRGGGVDFAKDNFTFSKIIGVDPSQKQINFCRSWCKDIDFYVGQATDIPLSDDSVDVITSIEASGYYLPHETYFKECARILKTGGKLIVAEHRSHFENFSVPDLLKPKLKLTKVLDITNNVNISCAISKYALPLNLTDPYSKIKTRSVLFNDEKKYIVNQENYIITVYEKHEI